METETLQTRIARLILLPKRALWKFLEDECPAQAAALAYYTVFSLPPLLLLVVYVAGLTYDRQAVVGSLHQQVQTLLGSRAADQISTTLTEVQDSTGAGSLAAVLGLLALLFSATTAFAQLQGSLNRVWDVKPDPQASEIKSFFLKRLVSFGMILSFGFLLVVSMVFSAMLQALSDVASRYLPAGISSTLMEGIVSLTSLVAFAFLFSAIFKFLPDAVIEWRDVAIGGLATAVMFSGGRFLIGFYLGNSDVTTVYGAAGSLALILLWTYYAAMIMLLGAEFTRSWTRYQRRHPQPEQGAVKVKKEEVVIGTERS